MKGSLIAVALLLVTLLTFGTATTLAEETKTKVIVLVDRDVVCPDDPVTLYSGSPSIRVTGEILSVSLEVTKSCRCRTCIAYEAHPNGNTISYNVCSGGNAYLSFGGYGAKDYAIKSLNITAQKSDPDCTVCHITAKITVEYTGDWVESPKGSQRNGQRGGRAPLSPIGAVVIAATLIALGAKRK